MKMLIKVLKTNTHAREEMTIESESYPILIFLIQMDIQLSFYRVKKEVKSGGLGVLNF